jgi:Lar family restriction alleviation protein
MSELKPCPFCGRTPKVLHRTDSLAGYFCAILCFCGGCSARALQAATGADEHEAYMKAALRWNRRVDARQLALKTRVCPMCEDCPDGCPVETPKDSRNIVTNADRIRSMTDEELVEFICGIDGVGDPDYCAIVEVCPDELEFNMYTPAENCMRCCFRWLQQPVEVVNSD